jgi:serine/threonine-protein kinase
VVSKGQVLNDRYRLLSLEGEGGMADVYKARDLALDRTVALKVLRAGYDAGNAFQREARAAAKLPHPNIVTIYDVGQDGDIQYIVMEYAEGQTLRDMLRAGTQLRAGQALDIALQICDAVGFAHDKGIIHCDVKPQNVLVQPDGKAKVTDFGIARAFTGGTSEQRGKLWGTPYYASPELISGQPLTPASDVYAIGIMLYEMLCGRRPFEGQTATEIARQHVTNAPPPIQQLNPRTTRYLNQVIDRTLAKEAKMRYSSANDLGKALRVYRQHSTSDTQPLHPVQATRRHTGRESSATPRTAASHTLLRPVPQRGVDWVMLLLGALAFLSVMGLLPLWGTVLTRALTPTMPGPITTVPPGQLGTPTPTQDLSKIDTPAPLTPTAELRGIVPDLVGQELARARQTASEASMTVSITEQRHNTQVPQSHVIEQTPLAGQEAPLNTQIGVVVSLGPEMVTMPDVLSFPVTVKQLDLEDLGLVVAITETSSIEPAGLVISQTPTAGTAITVGNTVTLTVSSGQQDLVQANFGDKVILLRCELNNDSPRRGDALQLIITWQVKDRLPEVYTLFIHLVDRDGRILAQRDAPPLGGSRPTNTWQPGEELLDPHVLSIPTQAALGDYWIHIGLYRGDHRLPVVDPGLAETKGNAVIVRQIKVTAN